MAYDWYKKINGFVMIEIEGYFSERFINLALSRGITIWNIKNEKNGKIKAKVVPKDFKKLKNITHKTGCKVKIIRKKGIPFLLFRYKKRKIIILLILCAIISLQIYNSYIWKIDIIGDFNIPIEEIKNQLKEENLKLYAKKKNINIDQLKINMALKRNDLAWIGVTISGTKATVEIVQKVMPEIEEFAGKPCNVVAKKDGIITKIYARDGLAIVEKDDYVQKGQVLISGIMYSEHAENRYVHADGEVIAKTWYSNKVKVPYKKDVLVKTGKEQIGFKIKLANYEINFLNNDTNFEKYDTITSRKQLKIFNRFVLPIEIEETKYQELAVESIELNRNQAESIAKNETMIGAVEKLPNDSEMINNVILVREYDDGIEAEVTIECIENIGTKEKIEG